MGHRLQQAPRCGVRVPPKVAGGLGITTKCIENMGLFFPQPRGLCTEKPVVFYWFLRDRSKTLVYSAPSRQQAGHALPV